eukprot:CAMPEP_0174998462 /NCGR_PEP_ID=MMETSP0005-20121125/1520_1 /TAXON_ID=420556 /ORGANISM="Ochromonas sp., Strain CCMP1393" /LENGTH=250 /DNA_ID=CAMNT_0016253097 /DNA_START=64 /DNA_END=813 /DNA_ORIENTATION=-
MHNQHVDEELSNQVNLFCAEMGENGEALSYADAIVLIKKYEWVLGKLIKEMPQWQQSMKENGHPLPGVFAIIYCYCPQWFHETISTRINNQMLVSALLVTLCGSFFLYPPDYSDHYNIEYKVWYFANFIAVSALLSAVLFGYFLLESAIYRPIRDIDRVVAVAKFKYIQTYGDAMMLIGIFALLLSFVVAATFIYTEGSAWAMGAVVLFLIGAVTRSSVTSNSSMTNSQFSHYAFIKGICTEGGAYVRDD